MDIEDIKKKFSYRYYGKIERGLANVTLETLVRLCEIFEVSLSDLFLFMDSDRETSEDREAVAVKVARLLSGKSKKNVKKLRLFLDEIL